ncbi:MAG: hypothetical protein RL354_1610, partial [Planctomycetota bacterium]
MSRSLHTPFSFLPACCRRFRARLQTLAVVLMGALALVAAPARAQDDTLKVGSTSPAITVADWTDVPASGFGQGSRTWVLHFFEV